MTPDIITTSKRNRENYMRDKDRRNKNTDRKRNEYKEDMNGTRKEDVRRRKWLSPCSQM
jgi:hypothetical protein